MSPRFAAGRTASRGFEKPFKMHIAMPDGCAFSRFPVLAAVYRGQIVGYFFDAGGIHGFLAMPVP
jgi:hypothetical protein